MASTKGTWRAGAWPDFGPFGLAEFCLHARPLTFSALKCNMQGLYSIKVIMCVLCLFCVCFVLLNGAEIPRVSPKSMAACE